MHVSCYIKRMFLSTHLTTTLQTIVHTQYTLTPTSKLDSYNTLFHVTLPEICQKSLHNSICNPLLKCLPCRTATNTSLNITNMWRHSKSSSFCL